MFKHILVPTDGSDIAERSGELAVSIAEKHDAAVSVISVVRVRNRERGDRSVGRMVDRFEEAGIDVESEVIESSADPADEILAFAEANDVDGIVMGTHGRTGVSRFILGSVALQTLQESSIPVITVHEDTDLAYDLENVLVPTDGSRSANAAADIAIELASASGARIHAMHITDDPAAREDEAQTPAHEVADRARNENVDVEVIVRRGRPHLEIAGYISEAPCDLVVMGSHGRTGLRRYLLGSVTERILRFSTVPVMAIRPPEVTATVEYLNYGVIENEGWSIDDGDLFEKAASANLDRGEFGSFEVDEGEFILDAAEAEGYDWPFHCRAGACVNCAAILVEGEVDMERCRSLSDEEQDEDNLRLTCVATPTSDEVRLVYNAKALESLKSRVL